MNHIFKNFLVILLLTGLWSCKKDEHKVIFEGGTSPVLKADQSGNILLDGSIKNNTAINFVWTNPNYKFNTGISSQDVNYLLQFDSLKGNFEGIDPVELSFSKELNFPISVSQLNLQLGKLGLPENVNSQFKVRLKSYVGNSGVPLYSNILTFTATPYLDVAVPLPVTDALYIIGNATPGGDASGWNNPVPSPSQRFTKTSSTTYEITIQLHGGKEFLVIPDNGSWANKYAITRGTNPDIGALQQGGNFGYNSGDNFYGPTADGTYKIVLNFKTGKYTITKL